MLPIVLAISAVSSASASFMVFGDWGTAAEPQKRVAAAMGKFAGQKPIDYVITTGDNVYGEGVHNVEDPQWAEKFTNIYTDQSLDVPWYSVLGNHDYGLNMTAEFEFQKDKRWHLEDYWYTKEMSVKESSRKVTFVFTDTNPSNYRCCSGGDPNTPQFWDNIKDRQPYEQKQIQWLNSTLAAIPADDWVIAVGHHPSSDLEKSLLQHNVHAYFAGHVHNMQHHRYKTANGKVMEHFVSGAGALASKTNPGTPSHTPPDQAWTEDTLGFTYVSFSADGSSMRSEFVTTSGQVIYTIDTPYFSRNAEGQEPLGDMPTDTFGRGALTTPKEMRQ